MTSSSLADTARVSLAPLRRLPVTVVVPTFNEADRLAACLESVAWAQQVIVVDGGSADDTVAIAVRKGARVLKGGYETIGAQRNAAIAAATTSWVLAIDADECVTPELRDAIAAVVQTPTAGPQVAFKILVRNRYLGLPMNRGSWGRDWHLRLFRAHGRFTEQRVHERLAINGPTGGLAGCIEHDSYRSLEHHLTKATTYARWAADDLYQRGRRVTTMQLVGRPAWRFVRAYFVDGNWRDGKRGFVFSVMHAWSAFARYALLWDRERQEKSTRR
jgi:glycosyltransferase involved in cell wall biosynthesis